MNRDGNIIQWEYENIKTKVYEVEKLMRFCRSEDRIYAGVFGGGLRCYDKNAELMWSAKNNPNEHYLRLSYNEKMKLLLAIGYKYGEPRTEPYSFIDAYEPDTGELIYTEGLGNTYAYAFINDASGVVCNDGIVYQIKENGVFSDKKYSFD